MSMPEDQQQQLAAFLDMWIGGLPEQTRFFNEENIGKLAKDHGIPHEFEVLSLILLEIAALAYWKESERFAADYAKHRKALEKLEGAAARLVAVLDELDTETLRVLDEAEVARGFKDHPIRGITNSAARSLLQPQLSATATLKNTPEETSDLVVLRNLISVLADDAQKAQRWAGKGKPGRRDDDSAADLMQMCFMIWTNIVQREFTLGWHNQQPDSDAARFCVDVAAIVDPKFVQSRIISASRKVRETGLNISNLEELLAQAEEFRKRLD